MCQIEPTRFFSWHNGVLINPQKVPCIGAFGGVLAVWGG
ncbi:hypothetical protein HBZS_108910 [Helicobacter bizzozeronii CCUG 35545]|nr:hypothetical protein HBZS_108910 [Helicobacter bizzozeronii CCUG 35545]